MTQKAADRIVPPTPPARALERRWHREIPISAAMGIAVREFDGQRLGVSAELEPNRNVHGTAFAGSLFSLASLAGWGQVYLQLERRALEGSIVFVEGNIRCLRPVTAEVIAWASWSEAAEDVLRALAAGGSGGRGRFLVEVHLEVAGAAAAEFRGEYAVKLRALQERSPDRDAPALRGRQLRGR